MGRVTRGLVLLRGVQRAGFLRLNVSRPTEVNWSDAKVGSKRRSSAQ